MNTKIAVSLFVLLLAVILITLGGCGGSSLATGVTDTSLTGNAPVVSQPTPAPTAVPVATGTAPTTTTGAEPVLIGYKKTLVAADETHLTTASAHVKSRFNLVPVVSADLTPQAQADLRKDPSVAYVEPDTIAHATADQITWNVTDVTATKVWPTGDVGSGVKVAIIDTGMDYRLADLAPNYAGGYNFIAKNTNPLDDNGHGTHVAGIIAAAAEGTGVKGVAPSARLYPLKVLSASGAGSYSNIIAALQWCVTNKMQIASMSLGADVNSKALHDACTAASNAGVLLVAAAGNSGTAGGLSNTVEYPAAYGAVIAVAAVDAKNARPYWSSTGPKVELAAPGVNISSDKLGGGLVTMSGTSMACPHVTGVAALVFASGVTKAATVRKRLDDTATDLGAAGRDPLFGYGLVNASAAVSGAVVASR